MRTVIAYFYFLSIAAVLLLWGISLVNGTVLALIKAVWTQKLPDGAFETHYSGIPIIDFLIALLVAFFYSGTNGHNPVYQHFLLNAYATLQPAFVWLYVEHSRFRKRSGLLQSPLFYGMLWQCFGAAISLPLFYAMHLSRLEDFIVGDYAKPNMTSAIPIAYILGAVVPVFVGMWTTWSGPVLEAGGRTPRAHQLILAAWQIDPVYVALIIWSLRKTWTNKWYTSSQRTSYQWARISYIIAAFTSAAGHFHLLARTAPFGKHELSFVHMFVPFPVSGPAGSTNILEKGPWLFLQYDFIIIALSSLSWVFVLLLGMERRTRGSALSLVLQLALGSVLIGAGATVSLALYWREEKLWVKSHEEQLVNPRTAGEKLPCTREPADDI